MRIARIRAVDSRVSQLIAVVFILILSLPLAAQQLTLRYFAGPPFDAPDGPIGQTYIGEDGANTMDRDAAGNFYFSNGSTIKKMSPAGEVTTIAGVASIYSWADGLPGDARFNGAIGLDRDDSGNLWIADTQNHVIRKIAPDGRVTTVAGMPGLAGFVNGAGTAARFNQPRGIAVDHTGVVYVSDYNNNSIRKITPDGTVSTFATASTVLGMDVDASNNLYAVDAFRVNRFTPAGVKTIIAGGSTRGFVDGTGSAAKFDVLRDIAVASDGSVMYVTDQWNGRVRKVTAAGVVTTVAGQPFGGPQLDGTGSAAKFSLSISGIVLDETTNILYVSDSGSVRVITLPAGVVTTQGVITFGYTNGPARSARFYELRGLAVDNSGNVYASDDNNHVIRKITPSGLVSTFAGNGAQSSVDGPANTASFQFPWAMTTDGTNLYVIDGSAIRKITPAGDVSTLAGTAWLNGSVDGTGSAARFYSPNDLVYDAFSDCLFVADKGNYTVRKVTMAGVVTTLAGRPGVTGTQNGTGTGALFKGPTYITADPNTGNLFVTEWGNYNIRRITQGGVVTNFSGSSSTDAHADGDANTARFKSPSGLTSDNAGNLYVVDFWGPTVRKVAPDGSVTTILGAPLVYEGSWREGTGIGARMSNPQRIATDRNGNFFIINPDGSFVAKAMQSIPDTASADPATAAVGVTRQLDAAPRNATSYLWEMVRRPANSNAVLSSPTLPNPIFTPDVIDRFTFRLFAEGSGTSGVSTIDVVATCETDSPAISVTDGSNPSCADSSTVTLDAGPWSSYVWSNGGTTRTITVTPSATMTYNVTVTDANGCQRPAASKTITVIPLLSSVAISGSGATAVCPSGTAGTFTAAVTGGGASTIQWGYRTISGGAVTNLAGRTGTSYTLAADDFAPGSYLLVALASAECGGPLTSNELAVTVHAPVSPPTVSASGPTTFCQGGSVALSAPAGYTYLWSNGATTQSIAVSASGSYSVAVTDANGCSATSAETSVTVHPAPPATITASGPLTFCTGDSVTLHAPAGYSYLWSTGETTDSIVVAESGSYSVTVTGANGCSAISAETVVAVNANPSATITPSGPTTFCEGDSVTLAAPAGLLYLWSTGAVSQSIDVTQPGNYSVTVTNTSGCSATSAETAVTVNANPSVTITPNGPTTFCEGGSVTLTAPAGLSYLWSTGAISQSIDVTQSGNYSVTVTNTSGCSATSAATAVTVDANPSATITPSGPTTFCEGGAVTLTASAGLSYVWSTGAISQSINVAEAGSYSVTVTNASGCSATSAATAVTINAGPAATITPSGPTTFCQGGSVTLTAPAGLSYVWSTGAISQSIDVTQAGSYSVTVTNASGCSATSAATAVTINANPTATITPSGPTTFCEGGSVTLTAPAGMSYLWSNGATSQSLNVTQAGSYSVTVTNASGCSASSNATTVTVNPLPTVPVITGPSSFCPSTTIVLTAPAGAASYLWSTGAVTQSINVGVAGTYTVTVTNAQGCSRTSATFTVTANAPTQITTHPASATIARNTTRVLSVIANGTAPLQYQWFTGMTGDTSKPVSGATSSSYTAGPFSKKGTYRYWVRVTSGTCTGSVANSNTATITVP